MKHLPSTKSLVAFQVSAQYLSFTQAAKILHLTQEAISQQVQGLERLLGVKLFFRLKQRLQLTEQGKHYLTFVNDALAGLNKGAESLLEQCRTGVLTVSVSPNFASKWLVHRLGDFITKHPDIELRVSATMKHIDLAFSDVDVAIRHGNNDWPDLDVTRLCEEHNLVVCSLAYFQRNKHLLKNAADLVNIPLLHDNSRQDWQRWFALTGVDTHINSVCYSGPQFDQTSMVLDAALEGQGVALTRSALARRDLLSARLITLFDVSMPAPFSYYIVHNKDAVNVEKIQRFKQWLLAQVHEEEQAYQNLLASKQSAK